MGSLPKTHLSFVLKQHKLSSDFARFGETKGTADGLFRALGPRHGAVDIGSGGPLTPPLCQATFTSTQDCKVRSCREEGKRTFSSAYHVAGSTPPSSFSVNDPVQRALPSSTEPLSPFKKNSQFADKQGMSSRLSNWLKLLESSQPCFPSPEGHA